MTVNDSQPVKYLQYLQYNVNIENAFRSLYIFIICVHKKCFFWTISTKQRIQFKNYLLSEVSASRGSYECNMFHKTMNSVVFVCSLLKYEILQSCHSKLLISKVFNMKSWNWILSQRCLPSNGCVTQMLEVATWLWGSKCQLN